MFTEDCLLTERVLVRNRFEEPFVRWFELPTGWLSAFSGVAAQNGKNERIVPRHRATPQDSGGAQFGAEQLNAAEAPAFARETNDFLADALRSHPTRLAGFATLPTVDPNAAAVELERTNRDYGFKGALIIGHIQGRYLDDKFFWPIFESAEALNVPIYLHPTQPPKPVIEASYAGFAPIVTDMLAGAGWGWHIETAIHVIRIILGGAFDRHPKLQLIVGHMGETLPFMLPRLDVMPMEMTKLNRPISSYLRENLNYTFSGLNFMPTFLDLLLQVGVDRILFSADYSYASMIHARAFLDRLPVSTADRERIAHGNAERLLGL